MEWQAFDDISPIGDKRGDWQAASIAAFLANVIIGAHGGTKRFKISDALLEFDTQPKEGANAATPARDFRVLKHYARQFAAMSRAESRPRPQRPAKPPKQRLPKPAPVRKRK